MKKLALFSVFLLLLLIIPYVLAQGITISLSDPYEFGALVAVNVYIEDAANVGLVSFDMNYDDPSLAYSVALTGIQVPNLEPGESAFFPAGSTAQCDGGTKKCKIFTNNPAQGSDCAVGDLCILARLYFTKVDADIGTAIHLSNIEILDNALIPAPIVSNVITDPPVVWGNIGPVLTCTDPGDDNFNIYKKGTTPADTDGDGVEEDYTDDCVIGEEKVIEYYCHGTKLLSSQIPCGPDMICYDGECRKPSCGDTDNDGVITADDVAIIQTELLKLNPVNVKADANKDSSYNALDLTAVKLHVAGLYELGSVNRDVCYPDPGVSICPNGVYEHGEECDLGALNGVGSGCVDCVIENPRDDATVIKAHPNIVTVLDLCGDGILLALAEQCDDGNNDDFDGCSHTCAIE